MRTRRLTQGWWLLGLGAALVLVGCGGDDTDAATVEAPPTNDDVEQVVEPATETETTLDAAALDALHEALAIHTSAEVALTVEEFERIQAGDRDFDVRGDQLGSEATRSEDVLAVLPQALGAPTVDALLADFRSANEALLAATTFGFEQYTADPERFADEWPNPSGEYMTEIFGAYDDATEAWIRSCLELAEGLSTDSDRELECVAAIDPQELGIVPETETVEAGTIIERELPIGTLRYEAFENWYHVDEASWAVAAPQIDPGAFWIGQPTALTAPGATPAFDAVVEGIPFQLDIGEWIAGVDELTVFESGDGDVGGVPARYWDIRLADDQLGAFNVYAVVEAETDIPVSALQMAPADMMRIWTFDVGGEPWAVIYTTFDDALFGLMDAGELDGPTADAAFAAAIDLYDAFHETIELELSS